MIYQQLKKLVSAGLVSAVIVVLLCLVSPGKADAALAASIFHFGEYTIGETKQFLYGRGIPVRL